MRHIQSGLIQIILASASPRRKKLLKDLLDNFDLSFKVIPSDYNEVIAESDKNITQFVQETACLKGENVSKKHKGLIISADTVVTINRRVLGKPKSNKEAEQMLNILSGKTHNVYTGIYLKNTESGKSVSDYQKTKVTFRNLTKNEIKYYISTGSPMDKAGAYGIQDDFGFTFVESINGDYYNVMGLPVIKVYNAMKKLINLKF